MKKLFFLIPALILSMMMNAAIPTITIDGDKSEWAEVPMLSEPGAWPMLKVIPAADAEMGTNALVYMMENTEDFDPTWAKYPKAFIDKDYNGATHTIDAYWAFDAMGLEYSATTGVTVGEDWVSFPKAMSTNNKVFEIGFPATYITDLESKFSFAMYYNSGAWFCPDRSEPAVNAFSPKNGFLYKTRSYATVDGTTHLTTANVYAHPSMGEVGEYVDFGLRDNGYDTIRWAAFPINLTQPAIYNVTANVTSTNSWKFEFWLVDVATNAIVAHIDAPSSSRSSSETSYTFGKLDLTSVPASKYMLKVKNRTAYSTVKLNSIDLTYAGGAPVAIPGTLNIDDVILSNEAWVDKTGVVDSILFTARGSEGHNSINFVKWKVNVTTSAWYNFKANVYRPDGSQRYEIKVLSNDENTEFASNSLTGMPKGLASIKSGIVYLEKGIYTIKIRNTYDYAKSRLLSVESEYIGGAVQDMPGTTAINEAWFSSEGTREDGKIDFPNSTIQDGWIKWNVSFANAGNYKVTVNIDNTNGHNYTVALYEDENDNSPIFVTEGEQKEIVGTLDLGTMEVPVGNYILKVTNSIQYSDAKLMNVQFSYEGGAVIDIPNNDIPFIEAILSANATRDASGIHFNGTDQYAKWNVHAIAGVYTFTFDVVGTNYGKYKLDINQNTTNVFTYTQGKDGSGQVTISNVLIPTEGDYELQMANVNSGADGYLTSLSATADETIFLVDENATDGSYIVEGISGKKPLLNRTFKGGMYNTICVPFDSYNSELENIFGADYELLEMESAVLEGNTLNLNFIVVAHEGNNFSAGKPYLIKPTQDVTNPKFSTHTIHNYTSNNIKQSTNADFIGSFVKGEIPAGENNLFLGPDDLLYFSSTPTPIKGTRAYFQLKGITSPQQVVKHARIVKGTQVITEIDLVGADNKSIKTIENGQLVIICDGVRYNALGIIIK